MRLPVAPFNCPKATYECGVGTEMVSQTDMIEKWNKKANKLSWGVRRRRQRGASPMT